MTAKLLRAAIVGASTLVGKELAEELNASTATLWDLRLLDANGGGEITSAGEEALVIQQLEPGSLQGLDAVFFAGDADTTRKHWREAVDAGAAVIDLSGALAGSEGVRVRSGLVSTATPDLAVLGVVPAHPAAVMLALVHKRLAAKFSEGVRLAATVLEPASQQGSAGVDELHAQTVALLSFQSVPRDMYDAQVAFNLNAALGGAARTSPESVAALIRRDVEAIAGRAAADACALQLIQAPVFHGYAASVWVEFGSSPADAAAVASALEGSPVRVLSADEDAPSNLTVTQQSDVLVRLGALQAGGAWLWLAADNLRLAARNAVACAAELIAQRPANRVQ